MKQNVFNQIAAGSNEWLDPSEVERLYLLQNHIDDETAEGTRASRLAGAQSEIRDIVEETLGAAGERCLYVVEGGAAVKALLGPDWPAENTSDFASAGREIVEALKNLREGRLQVEPSAVISGEFLIKDEDPA